MRISAARRARTGFSLIEILVAITIILFAGLLVASGSLAGNAIVRRGHHTEVAYQAAHQELERLRSLGVDNLPAIPAGAASTSYPPAIPAELPGGAGSVTLTQVTDDLLPTTDSSTGLVQAAVTVSWAGNGPDQGTTTLTTLIGKVQTAVGSSSSGGDDEDEDDDDDHDEGDD